MILIARYNVTNISYQSFDNFDVADNHPHGSPYCNLSVVQLNARRHQVHVKLTLEQGDEDSLEELLAEFLIFFYF